MSIPQNYYNYQTNSFPNPDSSLSQNEIKENKSLSYRKRTLEGLSMKPKLYEVQFGEKNPYLLNNLKFGNNIIKTTKYNLLTLLPKNLFYQFTRVSNIYFLVVSILTCMSFSPKQPASMIGTFVFVLLFTLCKDGFEDFGRYQQDIKNNNRLVHLLNNGKFIDEKCYKLMPGDIIKIKEDEECTCDILILKSSNKGGYLYLDTKNLDGETNLKEKMSLEELKDISLNENEFSNIQGKIETTESDADLNEWEGLLEVNNQKNIYCCIKNMILKGCIVKNTKFVYGIVIYVGHHTKIMKNSKKPKPKISKIMKTMNKIMYSLFAFTISICAIFSLCSMKFIDKNSKNYTYIFFFYDPNQKKNKPIFRLIIHFFTFFVSYAQIIPISLYVVMEMIKLFQSFLIKYDYEMFDLNIQTPSSCRESGLIEELGQIDFIFSDKTGTLTQNIMEFKKCFINGKVYGAETEFNECNNHKFSINGDMEAYKRLKEKPNNEIEKCDRDILELFFILLSTCHDVFPENENGKIIYQGSSPDDIALVKGAQQLGYEFIEKNFTTIKVYNNINDELLEFEIYCILPFDSERKRMSVILKDLKNNKYILFSKGSDSVMLQGIQSYNPLITKFSYQKQQEEIEQILNKFSREGLRILIMGFRELSPKYFTSVIKKYNETRKHNPNKLYELYNEIERDLTFLGCSAIEDKLQEGVPETINILMTCGIRLWVLTGDKQDTAEQIGRQCHLIDNDMKLFNLSTFDGNRNDLYEKMSLLVEQFDLEQFLEENKLDLDQIMDTLSEEGTIEEQIGNIALIIDGITLLNVLNDKHLRKMFFLLGVISKSVICCRVSPNQKSQVIKLVKSYGNFVTLSIGDGANDVPMILEASIGIGISGKEGTQAVRSADYAIGQFRFLEKLILFYGRNGYIKISKYICYYFYKNILLVFTELLFVFYNGFSGQIFFPDWYATMFNAVFTSWPCLFVFAFEKEHNILTCKKFPVLYRAGPKNILFNLKVFWIYVSYGIIHSILCFVIPAYSLKGIVNENGNTFNNWRIATVSFSLVIHVVSMKLLIISEFWNIFSLAFTIISVIFYYTVLVVLCIPKMGKIFQPEIIGVFKEIFGSYMSFIIIIFGPLFICLPDIIVKQIFFTFFPNPSEYLNKYKKDEDYNKILINENLSTNKLGIIIIQKNSKKYTKGYINESKKWENSNSNSFKIIHSLKDDLNNNTKYPLNDSNFDSKNDNHIFETLNKEAINNNTSRKIKKHIKSETNIKGKDLFSNNLFNDNYNDKNSNHPNEIIHSDKQKNVNHLNDFSENSSMFNSSKSNSDKVNVKVIEEEQNNNSSVLGKQEKLI